MKWPLHPIVPSTEMLVNPLVSSVAKSAGGPAGLASIGAGLSGHAAGVPAPVLARPTDDQQSMVLLEPAVSNIAMGLLR